MTLRDLPDVRLLVQDCPLAATDSDVPATMSDPLPLQDPDSSGSLGRAAIIMSITAHAGGQ